MAARSRASSSDRQSSLTPVTSPVASSVAVVLPACRAPGSRGSGRRVAPFQLGQELVDALSVLQAAVQLKMQFRDGTEAERARQVRAEEAARALQARQGAGFLFFRSHDAHPNGGVTAVGRHGDAGERNEAYPGVLDLGRERLRQRFLEQGGQPLGPVAWGAPHWMLVAESMIRARGSV